MPIDIQNLFEEKLPAAWAQHREEVRAINATYQLNVSGVGEWFLDLTRTGPSVERGQKPADCTISISGEDFEKLYENPASGVHLFFAGRLKVSGNPMLGMKLEKLLSLR